MNRKQLKELKENDVVWIGYESTKTNKKVLYEGPVKFIRRMTNFEFEQFFAFIPFVVSEISSNKTILCYVNEIKHIIK